MPQSNGSFLGFVHRRRRGAELFLLILALLVGIGAYAAVGLGVEGKVPADIVGYGGWLALLVIGCHVVVRFVAPYADPVLLPVVAALNGLGLAVIHRIDLAYEAQGKPHGFAQQQLIWMTLGVLLFAGTLVIAFAGYLVLHREALALAGRRVVFVDLPRGRDLGPILAMWLVSLGILVFQHDLGSSLLFFGLFLIMLYVATERPGWLVVGGGLFLVGAFAAYQFIGHVAARVDVWLNPMYYYSDAHGAVSFQPVEAQFGMGWGGLIGRGFGGGSPERVPYANSDFIISSIGEELGLTAVIAVILLYGLIVERA